jgi:hypothetical protein
MRGDIHLDQLDRRIATRADRALGFLRNLVGPPAFQAMNGLASFRLFSGKGG